jgi:hypothetical protein
VMLCRSGVVCARVVGYLCNYVHVGLSGMRWGKGSNECESLVLGGGVGLFTCVLNDYMDF